ncbi:SEFIR domain-containing protein [Amycolatopsis sp. DG1A-15b]|uniref:SEFIR domain-containing protein n=1 Tax=Amycolatopsis sp. DG1A-15b TaxID=3052846 RepID=UPI00255B59AF|nr:SEFIR domain-containing protein [Amycolatopsis sp. DG1A-15b]WIX92527.1 TIR domain-containing protein [Amycolatopsis sp. DG1A-15b]
MADESGDRAGDGDRKPPRVFVTYSHDSEQHKESVLRFCTFLRAEAGIDLHLDRWYENVRRDWSVWAIRQLTEADFILVVASPGYRRKADGWADDADGRGAQFEGAIIRDNLTRNLPAETARVLPVVLPGRNADEIPAFLHAATSSQYTVSSFTHAGAAELLAVLRGVARHPMPPRGRFVEATPGGGRPAAYRREPAHVPAAVTALLDQVCDDLAAVVHGQWRAEQRLRRLQDPAPIEIRWEPCDRPELEDHSVNIGLPPAGPRAGGRLTDIAEAFDRVPSGRLVVLGEPGAGKTVLAVRLTLDLVARRDPGAPVPVLFSVASWDPGREALHDWLVRRLIADYPGLGSRPVRGNTLAGVLVGAGRVTPVLDGLDELPTASRGAAVHRINAALDHGDPLVVTCRVEEYAAAVAGADVITAAAVLVLRRLGVGDLAEYLPRTARAEPDAGGKWDPVIAFLRRQEDARAGHLLSVLGVPLMTSLARAVYSDTAADPAELIRDERFVDPAAVADHLIDRLIPVAYDEILAQQGPPRWTAEQATRWLGFLAAHDEVFDGDGIAWWRLDRAVPRALMVVVGVVVGAACAGLPVGMVGGVAVGLPAGVAGGVASGLVNRSLAPTPSTMRLRWHGALRAARRRTERTTVPVGWPVATALVALALWIAAGPLGALVAGVTILAAFGLDAWFDVPAEVGRAASPDWLLRADRTAALSRGAARGGVIGIVVGMIMGPETGAAFGLAAIVVSVAYTAWGRFIVTRIWCTVSGRFPLRLMAFLDDAHKRGVLRRSGGTYEFRHAILRDWLHTKERRQR